MTNNKSVFISYRRSNTKWIALTLFKELTARGYDTFWDIDSIGPGRFDEIILSQIEARTHFVMLLAHGTLDRMNEADDWVYREVRHALKTGRNIVPVEIEDFDLHEHSEQLPVDVRDLLDYNTTRIRYEFFDESIERLVNKYLVPRDDIKITPAPANTVPVVQEIVQQAINMPKPTRDQLAGEVAYQHGVWSGQAYDKPDEIISAYTTVINLDPGHTDAYINRGLAYYSKRDFDSALTDFGKVLEANPDHARAQGLCGMIYFNQGKFPEALAAYDKSLSLDPSQVKAWVNRGLTHQLMGNYQEALADFDEAIRRDPTDYEAVNNRGRLQIVLGNLPAALVDLTETLRLKPGYVAALANRSVVYMMQENFDAALADLSTALQYNPEVYPLYNNRGEVYLIQGKYAEALDDFSQVLKLRPDFENGIAGAALAYDALDQFEEAKRLWQFLIDKDARFKDIDWVTAHFHWTDALATPARKLIDKLDV